jgi:hypothetical protein
MLTLLFIIMSDLDSLGLIRLKVEEKRNILNNAAPMVCFMELEHP